MRADSIGMFWEDLPKVRGKGSRGPRERGAMPVIPPTGWRPPTEFPNLSAAKVIGFDTETYDPELLKAGPGWGRKSGHLIGVSLAVEDGTSWYFPIRHGIENGKQVLPEHEAAMNMDPENVLRYVNHVLRDNRPKVGANLLYDVGWLMEEGVSVGGSLFDVQYAEALLNSETPRVDLDSLGERYLGLGKTTSVLYEWLADWCGGTIGERQRANLFLSPPSLAGPYGEGDAALPIAIMNRQWGAMAARGVLDLFNLECRLIPLLVRMRMKGAPVDVNRAEEVHEELGLVLGESEKRLRDIVGQPVNPNARDSLTSAFRKLGIPIPEKTDTKTKVTKVSYDAAILEGIDHPLAAELLEYRRTEKVRNTFIKGYILDKHVEGRIHCSFHPLKSDSGGARSGRFSSSDPNLQNIPVRTALGKRVRSCFVATKIRWKKIDYSQIEYRMLAHHAVGEGSDDLRALYHSDPNTDYHVTTQGLVKRMTGLIIDRRPIKNINFGLIYGMSEPKLARDLGLTPAKGTELFAAYHKAAPYARATMTAAANDVHRLGYVETILGRKSDFTRWGPKRYEAGVADRTYEDACRKWGPYNIERSRTHKALNRKLQGGAADVMKQAMVVAYEEGLFEESACGMPLLTVHDELDFDDGTELGDPIWDRLTYVLENAMPQMRIPIKVETTVGPNWGAAE